MRISKIDKKLKYTFIVTLLTFYLMMCAGCANSDLGQTGAQGQTEEHDGDMGSTGKIIV